MSRLFGKVRQTALVVHDLERTLEYWTGTMGMGPFHVFADRDFDDYRYYGEPAESPVIDLACYYDGYYEFEIIAQKNDAPSVYRDFLASGRDGVQHLASWVASREEYDAKRALALSRGLDIAGEGEMVAVSDGVEQFRCRVAYYSGNLVPGGLAFEVAEGLIPEMTPLLDMLERSTVAWDGTDPVRYL